MPTTQIQNSGYVLANPPCYDAETFKRLEDLKNGREEKGGCTMCQCVGVEVDQSGRWLPTSFSRRCLGCSSNRLSKALRNTLKAKPPSSFPSPPLLCPGPIAHTARLTCVTMEGMSVGRSATMMCFHARPVCSVCVSVCVCVCVRRRRTTHDARRTTHDARRTC